MTIWEIDREMERLLNAVDEETGEALFDIDAFEALQMEREAKIENLALAVKNMTAEAAAIKAEEEALAKRRATVEAKAKRAKEYLDFVCAGEGFKSAKAVVSYRPSTSCEIDAESLASFVSWAQADAERNKRYLTYADPKPAKEAISDALKAGTEIPFARLVTKRNIQVK